MNTHLRILTEDIVSGLLSKLGEADAQKALQSAKENNAENGRFKMVITTQDIDRDGESVLLDGWDMENYMRNPVVLLFHDTRSLPVGVTETLTKSEAGWVAEGSFASAEANPVAQQVRQLYDMGIMRASSVGFMPKMRDRMNPSIITKAELFEWSFVPVPCNPNALSLLEQHGMDVKELVTKGFLTEVKEADVEEIKTGEPVETKGQIEDTLQAQDDMRDKKGEYLMPFWGEVFKFLDAYCSDMTPVEDFPKLVGELATNLAAIQPQPEMPEMEDDMKSFISVVKDWKKTVLEVNESKSGRVLSKKNRDTITAAVGAMDAASKDLGELLKSTDATQDSETDSSETVDANEVKARFDAYMKRESEAKELVRSAVTSLQKMLSTRVK